MHSNWGNHVSGLLNQNGNVTKHILVKAFHFKMLCNCMSALRGNEAAGGQEIYSQLMRNPFLVTQIHDLYLSAFALDLLSINRVLFDTKSHRSFHVLHTTIAFLELPKKSHFCAKQHPPPDSLFFDLFFSSPFQNPSLFVFICRNYHPAARNTLYVLHPLTLIPQIYLGSFWRNVLHSPIPSLKQEQSEEVRVFLPR